MKRRKKEKIEKDIVKKKKMKQKDACRDCKKERFSEYSIKG